MDASDSPTNFDRTSEGPMDRKAACASPATALASFVLPQPGGPYRSMDAATALTPVSFGNQVMK